MQTKRRQVRSRALSAKTLRAVVQSLKQERLSFEPIRCMVLRDAMNPSVRRPFPLSLSPLKYTLSGHLNDYTSFQEKQRMNPKRGVPLSRLQSHSTVASRNCNHYHYPDGKSSPFPTSTFPRGKQSLASLDCPKQPV